jgi:excisionase family DNA binding protein
MPELHTITEVANILRISERTVYEYIYSGKLRAAKIANQWRMKPEWIDEFIEQSAKNSIA